MEIDGDSINKKIAIVWVRNGTSGTHQSHSMLVASISSNKKGLSGANGLQQRLLCELHAACELGLLFQKGLLGIGSLVTLEKM